MTGSYFHWDGDDLVLKLYIQPRAGKDEWVGEHDGALKLRITAPPVDGKANDRLERLLAREFGVARAAVELLAGAGSRHKRFRIRAPRKFPDFIHGPDDG